MDNLTVELTQHIINTIQDQDLTEFDDLHYLAFNEDYYIIGYYQASEWIKGHDLDVFEMISDILEWEMETMGEINIKPSDINAERIVNLWVYIKGEEILSEYDLKEEREQLLHDLKEGVTA
tara:strand:+ start:155 stop:517 length:363 start_codon:yes stop_codon:yes gene_type:complete